MACGTISIGSNVDCSALPKGGTKAKLMLINYDHIDSVTTNADGKITAITLIAGVGTYLFYGFRNDVKKSDEVANPGIGLNQFLHKCGFVIYERTQVQKNNIENIARGRFVAIPENKGRDADAFEVIGLSVGVEIVVGPIRNAHENGGFFMINLSTPEGEFEDKLPQTLGTSYSNGKALFDALVLES